MTRRAAPVLATGFGGLMAAAGAAGTHGWGFAGAFAVAGAVAVGVVFRPAATVAVLLAVGVIAVGDAGPVPAAVCGLCAAGYLVARHPAALTVPTVAAAAVFSGVGLAATAFPLELPWLPLLGPPAALGCYVLVIRPFLARS